MQRAATAFDPDLATHNVTTMSALLVDGLAGRRLPVVLMTAFGALALLLASVGVYAMFAAMAAAREREFGVRVALGSSRQAHRGAGAAAGRRVDGRRTCVGGVVGVVHRGQPAAQSAVRRAPVRSAHARARPAPMLLACATLALLGPVRRATQVDPTTVLR